MSGWWAFLLGGLEFLRGRCTGPLFNKHLFGDARTRKTGTDHAQRSPGFFREMATAIGFLGIKRARMAQLVEGRSFQEAFAKGSFVTSWRLGNSISGLWGWRVAGVRVGSLSICTPGLRQPHC